jgi:hypothetical protein
MMIRAKTSQRRLKRRKEFENSEAENHQTLSNVLIRRVKGWKSLTVLRKTLRDFWFFQPRDRQL